MKLRTIFILCVSILLCLTSCSDKKQDTAAKDSLTPDKYEESTLPEGFVFPGDPDKKSTGVDADVKTDNETYTEKARSVAAYVFEHTNITKYTEYISDAENGCSIDYVLDEGVDISTRSSCKDITVGTEKFAVSLPTTVSELLGKGFTWLGEEDSRKVMQPDGDNVLTLCTPETDEIIGFAAKTDGETEIVAEDASINGIMLTSFNNFTVCGSVNGSTSLGEAISAVGAPDIITVSASEGECAVMMTYFYGDGSSVAVLADGETRGLIAVYVTVDDE